ncbi:hypothetical protein C8R42DRAFT_780577 [Lentinula raphanica]|nr:hypothetical protein C8R42DRAFT_780577 [Lentinula raphanica]
MLMCKNDTPTSVKHCHVHSALLSDLEFATYVMHSEDDLGATSRSRTGTKPYLAHEQHETDWKGPLRYRHDLESVFYVMTLFTFSYSSPSEKASNPSDKVYQFEQWHQEDDTTLRRAKHELLIAPSNWLPPVTQFFAGFGSWLSSLQRTIFFGFIQRSLQIMLQQNQLNCMIFQPDQTLSENQEIDDETLGGYVCYHAVVFIIHRFEGEQLVTHDAESRRFLKSQVESYVSEE